MIAYTGKPECDIRDVLIAQLTSQRDELLAALEYLVDMDVSYKRGQKVEDAVEKAKCAIASVKCGAL